MKKGNPETEKIMKLLMIPFQQPLKIMMADGKCEKIYEGHDCGTFESKKTKLPEGILDVISL